MAKKPKIVVPRGKRLIYRPVIRTKDGRVLYAWQFGVRAFPLLIDA